MLLLLTTLHYCMSESFRIDIDQIHDENYGSSRLIVVLLFDSTILYSVFTKKYVFWAKLAHFDQFNLIRLEKTLLKKIKITMQI